jgi:DNA-binding transcriptional ArsR family regulator/uncharacterized protein YndB with AHSA1/START domain
VETNSYQAIEALADPTRRAILERLLGGPLPVKEIASGLPVTRPAVSQHLGVLKRARLVSEQRQGTFRVYRLEPGGLDALRAYLDNFWSAALSQFAEAAARRPREEPMTNQTATEPVRKQIAVATDVESAFRTFTEDIATWWPVEGHSKTGAGSIPVLEQREGGRMYEQGRDGTEHDWATILVYEPPHRVVLEWKVNSAAPPTEVEVRFSPDGDGTRVELEHRGWELYPSGDTEERESYDSGWPRVLERFREAAS